jgi:hypothetical protein
MKIVDPRVDPALVPEGSRCTIIAEHQPEYLDLPSIRTPGLQVGGRLVRPPYVITRWEPTLEERAAIVRGEDIYITLIAFGAIAPMRVSVGVDDWLTADGS